MKTILKQLFLIITRSKSYPATPLSTWVYHMPKGQVEYQQIKTLIKYLRTK